MKYNLDAQKNILGFPKMIAHHRPTPYSQPSKAEAEKSQNHHVKNNKKFPTFKDHRKGEITKVPDSVQS